MNFLSGLWNTVTNWLPGAAGAIAQTALKSAAAGALIGAATAAIQGKDIMDGAMRGAAIGGIAGGVFGSMNAIVDSGKGLGDASIDVGDNGTPGRNSSYAGRTIDNAGESNVSPSVTEVGKKYTPDPVAGAQPQQQNADTPWYKDEGNLQVAADFIGGAAGAYGDMKTAETQADSIMELEKYRELVAQNKIKNFEVATNFEAQTSNINRPGKGLLAQELKA